MKKQEKNVSEKQTLSKTEKMAATIEHLRNENHNLKRRLKRYESKKQEQKDAIGLVSATDCASKIEEVKAEGIEDIKKKLQEQGLTEKEVEIATWFVSRVTDLSKK